MHRLRLKLQRLGTRTKLIAILIACAAMLEPNAVLADMIPVRHTEGLEPHVTEAIVKLMVSAPGGKVANAAKS